MRNAALIGLLAWTLFVPNPAQTSGRRSERPTFLAAQRPLVCLNEPQRTKVVLPPGTRCFRLEESHGRTKVWLALSASSNVVKRPH